MPALPRAASEPSPRMSHSARIAAASARAWASASRIDSARTAHPLPQFSISCKSLICTGSHHTSRAPHCGHGADCSARGLTPAPACDRLAPRWRPGTIASDQSRRAAGGEASRPVPPARRQGRAQVVRAPRTRCLVAWFSPVPRKTRNLYRIGDGLSIVRRLRLRQALKAIPVARDRQADAPQAGPALDAPHGASSGRA